MSMGVGALTWDDETDPQNSTMSGLKEDERFVPIMLSLQSPSLSPPLPEQTPKSQVQPSPKKEGSKGERETTQPWLRIRALRRAGAPRTRRRPSFCSLDVLSTVGHHGGAERCWGLGPTARGRAEGLEVGDRSARELGASGEGARCRRRGVGKSCLLLRFSDGSFTTSFITTIGIDFKIRTIELDDKRIKLQIWDTAGQERFRTITTAYYRGAMGILLVYDVTDESSFNNIRNWIRNIEQHASDNVNKILVGNKADMDESKRAVPTSKGQALADEYGIKFFETSAKTNLNVEQVFFSIARDIKQRLAETDSKPEDRTIKINKPDGDAEATTSQKSACCGS
ncbi:hypothetical protein GUJ93_ZPchr0007g3933 [Zizania palustris]|uniref:Uncharacterized protein n=1 Tax=Zizania palustris TaxID=103762 RepID=A0A8J5T6U7_ZIZPA|nr:hypothetical protein GUJ93_ZPchr0007g3933 [Zizania palustris]